MTEPDVPRNALRNPLFRRLLTGLAVSSAGDWLSNVALLAFVYERSHSATWVAVTTAARLLPVVVLGPVGGVLADRFDRRRLMVLSDLVRAACLLALTVVAALGLPLPLAPLLVGLATAASCPYAPCVATTTPRLVGPEQLAGANAARSAVGAAAIVVGPAAGGLLLAVGSPVVAFAVNAASFVLCALLVASLPAGALFHPPVRVPGSAAPRLLADLRAGLDALRSSRPALRLVGADLSCSVVYGAQTVLLVLVARSFGVGDGGYGWLLAGCGAGGVLGTLLAPRLSVLPSRPVLAGALLLVALPLPLFTLAPSLVEGVALCVVGGAGAIAVEVLADTGLQRCLDEDTLGRAYGFAYPASVAGIVAGSLLAAPLVALVGLGGTFVVLAIAVTAHALLLTRPARRSGALAGPAQVDTPAA